MKLIPDLKEFIELLNLENVRYLVIGGWAINRYAEPRFTGDIDFFVSDSKENEDRLRLVLTKFGFGSALPQGQKLFAKKIIMLGRPPNRIDLLSSISGVDFNEAYPRGQKGRLDGIDVMFISKEDLIKNKLAAGREKDLLDIKAMEKFNPFIVKNTV